VARINSVCAYGVLASLLLKALKIVFPALGLHVQRSLRRRKALKVGLMVSAQERLKFVYSGNYRVASIELFSYEKSILDFTFESLFPILLFP
jgi:hypothetical protein